MQGYTFHRSKTRPTNIPPGRRKELGISGSYDNIIAVCKETSRQRKAVDGLLEGFAAVFYQDNSGVAWTALAPEVLGEEVDEQTARRIHPRLFERLDQPS